MMIHKRSNSSICFQAEIEQRTQLHQILLQGHQHCNSEGQKAAGRAKMGNRQFRRLSIVKKIFECGRCSWMVMISMLRKEMVSKLQFFCFSPHFYFILCYFIYRHIIPYRPIFVHSNFKHKSYRNRYNL